MMRLFDGWAGSAGRFPAPLNRSGYEDGLGGVPGYAYGWRSQERTQPVSVKSVGG